MELVQKSTQSNKVKPKKDDYFDKSVISPVKDIIWQFVNAENTGSTLKSGISSRPNNNKIAKKRKKKKRLGDLKKESQAKYDRKKSILVASTPSTVNLSNPNYPNCLFNSNYVLNILTL